MRVGYTFFIGMLTVRTSGAVLNAGIIPFVGDAVNASLNHFLVVRPSKKLDIPSDLVAKMVANNAVSLGLG
jgi:hypothetical protein